MVQTHEEPAGFARLGLRKLGASPSKTSYLLQLAEVRCVVWGGGLMLRRHTLLSAAQNIAAKLSPKFYGPFRIVKIFSPVVYEFANLDGTSVGKDVPSKFAH